MPDTRIPYRGRFAPSPTGPLHLGSLIAALASWLDARCRGGTWLVRIEDLDPPREEPGAARRILHSLECHGLQWDGDILWQSSRAAAYAGALDQLVAAGHLFRCECTRQKLGPDGTCVGRCRERQAEIDRPRAVRVAVPSDCRIAYCDRRQGAQVAELGRELPDFVVRRRDGLYAYQLAVVVDDAGQGITQVVRGSDLLDSTPRQILLQQLLGYPSPQYCHLPVIVNSQGQKLSKQTRAPALDDTRPVWNLREALHFLQQEAPPPQLRETGELLAFAVAHWDLARVPPTRAIGGPGGTPTP